MMLYRKTAIVSLSLPSDLQDESVALGERESVVSLPLNCEREYGVFLRIDGREYSARAFRCPINDEEWRAYVTRLRDSNLNRNERGYRAATAIRSLARALFESLSSLSPRLSDFLGAFNVPRRLVIQSKRPELHTLPWGALYNSDAVVLASTDLSIVQAWDGFSELSIATSDRLNLVFSFGEMTKNTTEAAIQELPEFVHVYKFGEPATPSNADILHIEAHGNAVTNAISDIGGPWKIAKEFGTPRLALLWSCFSAAANSWGESPALCLHRKGADFVLSFQAQLHNEDATSISMSLYRDVFGPAASRDPETALLRIRCDKFEKEFGNANWASMMIFMRQPLDLTALPMSGTWTPASAWTGDSLDEIGKVVQQKVKSLTPGSLSLQKVSSPILGKLPKAICDTWRGAIVRLDGFLDPLTDSTVQELNLPPKPGSGWHPAEQLVWFFEKIAHYGSPLIVWANTLAQHLDFLHNINRPPGLTFLLLANPELPIHERSIVDLVEQDLGDKAAQKIDLLAAADDESWSAAYFAVARLEGPEKAVKVLERVQSSCERLLLSGNYVSRFKELPSGGTQLTDLQASQEQAAFYRSAIKDASERRDFRDIGRGKLELAYLLGTQGETSAAESMYRAALEDLRQAHCAASDQRWHSALARVHRDWADLLSTAPERTEEASILLQGAVAIHAFQGRKSQLAYCHTTAARIAFTAKQYSGAAQTAMDAANIFEQCQNWRGWTEPVEILLRSLAEMRDSVRMKAVAELAAKKIEQSNLSPGKRSMEITRLRFRKAEALWIAGNLDEARHELSSLPDISFGLQNEVERLKAFLRTA